MKTSLTRTLAAALAFSLMAFSSIGHADVAEEEPSALAMTTDALFVRPAMFGVTLVGGAVYVVSLPFSLLGGNAEEAAETLFLKPAETTFIRCLGCTRPGRKGEAVSSDGSQ
ncbi:hypothetical protein [Tamilnaduibacter salinus]|nr:hypothetical protein [Tamilnaduibacter salinus]PAV24817.1 hypothetical protein CF392_14180 [Tamilnaduibacter salinus]